MPCQRYPPNSVQANLPAPEIEKARRCCFGGCILKATRISHHFQAWKVHFPWSASLSSCKRLRIGSNKSIQQPSDRPQHTGQKDNESRNLLEDRNSGSRNKRPRETSIFPTLLEGFHVSNQEKNTINDFHFKTVQLSTYTIYFSMVNLLESSPFLSNSWVSGAQVEVVIRSQFLLKVLKTCLRILRHTVEMELHLFSSDFRRLFSSLLH